MGQIINGRINYRNNSYSAFRISAAKVQNNFDNKQTLKKGLANSDKKPEIDSPVAISRLKE